MSGSTLTDVINAPGTSPATYVSRQISVTITLGEGPNGQKPSGPISLAGLRVVANITKRASPSFDAASIRIYGMTPSDMNKVSTLGVPQVMIRPGNTIKVIAGDAINGLTSVFSGNINRAYQVLNDAPETYFQIDSWQGLIPAMTPDVTPVSTPGQLDVATTMQTLASQQGFNFENNGVDIKLPISYYAGTVMDQMQAIAHDADIEMYIDSSTEPAVLAIWPKNKTRGSNIPLVQASPGFDAQLVGYPQFEQFGIQFRTIFSPLLKLGGMIKMNSSLYPPSELRGSPAGTDAEKLATAQAAGPNGYWFVSAMNLNLAAQVPNGPWFNEISGTRAFVPLP
jgi:hypothetical protein